MHSWSIFHFIVFMPPHLLFLQKMFLCTIPFLVQLLHLVRNSNTFQMREPSPFVFLSLLLCQRIFNLHLHWCKMKLPLCLIPLLSLKMSILHLHQLNTSISHSRNPPSWLADYKTYFPRRMNLFLPRFILIRNLNLIKNQLLSPIGRMLWKRNLMPFTKLKLGT